MRRILALSQSIGNQFGVATAMRRILALFTGLAALGHHAPHPLLQRLRILALFTGVAALGLVPISAGGQGVMSAGCCYVSALGPVPVGADGQGACPGLDAAALTPRMIACARAEKEAEVAIAKPGVKVCRKLTVGIAVEDWIRGVVVEAAGGRVGVRIDDPGRIQQTLNGKPLTRGEVVWDAVSDWTPCL